MCSPSWSPLPPPSPPDPSRSSQCTRSEHLSHASNTLKCLKAQHEVGCHPQAPHTRPGTKLPWPQPAHTFTQFFNRKAHELPASRLPLSSAQRPICRRQVPRGLRSAGSFPSRHHRGRDWLLVGAVTPHPAACLPACTPSSQATNVRFQLRQQTAPIHPPSPKSRPDKSGPRVWESLPSHLHGVQLPTHPLVFGGNGLSQSCSPRPVDWGLPRSGREHTGTLQPGPTSVPGPQPGPCCWVYSGWLVVGQDLKREPEDGRAKSRDPCSHHQDKSKVRTSTDANQNSDQRKRWETMYVLLRQTGVFSEWHHSQELQK